MLPLILVSITLATVCTISSTSPISFGINIIFIALMITLSFGHYSSWYAFLTFLIYVGGMLVVFSYFLAITPNQHISTPKYMWMMVILAFFMAVYLKMPMITQATSKNYMYTQNLYPSLIMMILILLIVMVIVVKITGRSKGPLRPFMSSA